LVPAFDSPFWERIVPNFGVSVIPGESQLRKRGITPRIARRGIESSERLGRHRWVVERTLSWVNRFRRLKIRYERRDDVHQAFLDLGCALICWRYVQRLC
jgi:IS5 family transposase